MSIEKFFSDPATRQRLYSGPLTAHLDAFAERLASQGYAGSTAREKIRLVAGLSRWLDRRKLETDNLNEQCIRQFLDDRSRRGFTDRDNAATCRSFLAHLREVGCLPAAPAVIDDSAFNPIESDYARYLSQERGLAPATLLNYLPTVRRFLTERFGVGPPKLNELCPQDSHRFILRHVHTVSPGQAKLIVTILRSFMRYLHQHGYVALDLSGAIPSVANWRFTHLPKALTAGQVEHLLKSCDRSIAAGQRDYAVLLLLARLGLRAGEVVTMRLDDIHWEVGLLTIRGKGLRHETLPLPHDVGEALANYLRYVRPRCTTRRVFIRLKAPYQGFTSSAAICDIVRRALARAELDPACKGAHLLRHSLATRMLRNGASLAEIGDILRHSQPQTTQIYAKVDVTALRALAEPWPRCGMSELQQALDEYLAIRRALGYKLYETGLVLQQFVQFAEREEVAFISTELALRWATQPVQVQPAHWARRLSIVRGFARYRSASDPRTEVPPVDLLPHRVRRPSPYIYTDNEVTCLLKAAQQLPSAIGLRRHTYATLFGLITVTGMRVSEPLGLDRDDVDLTQGILTIRETKFGKTRWVPIHSSTQRALQRYAVQRDHLCPNPQTPSFFISERGSRLTTYIVRHAFVKLSRQIGLRGPTDSHGPRLHDFRHRFAVNTLLGWYRSGIDVERHLPELATYLGHAHVTDTYWYLTATPELLQLAARRLDRE